MPTLTIIAGPARGKRFNLTPGRKFSMGRDPLSVFPLTDNEASRHHAEIFERDNIFYIKDFKSTNGTYLNGVRITEQSLNDQDQIRIGSNVLIFVVQKTPLTEKKTSTKSSDEVEATKIIEEDFLAHTMEIKLDHEQTSTEKVSVAPVDKEATSPKLSAIYKISKVISSEKSAAVLLEKILKLLVEYTKADEGYILFWDKRSERITAPMVYPPEKKQLKMSRTIVKRVIESGRPLLTSDAMVDPKLRASDSALMLDIKSVICVPMTPIEHGQVVLYLESNKLGWSFAKSDLELAAALALQSGMMLITQEGAVMDLFLEPR